VKIVKPAKVDPIPLQTSKASLGTILLKFAVLLVLATGALMLAWYR